MTLKIPAFAVLLRFLIILVPCILTGVRIIRSIDHESILDGLVNSALGISTAIIWIMIARYDVSDFRRFRNAATLAPGLTGLAIACFIMLQLHQLAQRDLSPVAFSIVTTQTDFNGIRIDFRKDGTFKRTEWCLGADYYRGYYTIKDSIIRMSPYGGSAPGRVSKLVVRNGSRGGTSTTSEVVAIDNVGNELGGGMKYRILN